MKTKILTLITLALLLFTSLSGEIVKQQSFEKLPSDTWPFTTDPAAYYNESAYSIFHSDSVGFPPYLATLPDGDKLWNCENTGYTNTAIHELTFNTVDISSYTGILSLKFYYYAFRYKESGGDDPWTSTDNLIGYYVEYDNGTTWNTLETLSTGTGDWTQVSINIPEGSDYVRLRFVVKNLGWQEIGTFDYISIERTDPPTPINLTSFDGKARPEGIELTWKTESETENNGFNIYRNSELIAYVQGAGTSSESHDYSYTDTNVIPGNTYTYMLADLSYAGVENRFENKSITLNSMAGDVLDKNYWIGSAYPNPFNPATTLDYSLTETNNVEVAIYNMKGEKITSLFNGEQAAGAYSLTWDADNINSGIYILRISVDNHHETRKLLLVK